MKIAFAASEAYPFVKTGGLADVAYSLPKALAKKGHDVRLFIPRYYKVDKDKFKLKQLEKPLGVPFGYDEKWAAIYESGHLPAIKTYFIEHDDFFNRDGLYDDGYNEYPDNAERFAFFSRAILQALKALDFKPDIIHCNDWQTGLIPVFLKTHYLNDPFYKNTGNILTIHNVGYQGVFHKYNFICTQLGREYFNTEGLEYYDEINYLKGGILFADAVTTVSKKYAIEIQDEEYGYKLAPIFRKIKKKLYGITNGVDYDKWNPATDRLINKNFSVEDLSGKVKCKTDLQNLSR